MRRSGVRASSAPQNLVVLDGEVAVPCDLQPAIAGSISIERYLLKFLLNSSGIEASIYRNRLTLNSVRPGREQRQVITFGRRGVAWLELAAPDTGGDGLQRRVYDPNLSGYDIEHERTAV